MDWYIPNETPAIGSLRGELHAHLLRHAVEDSDIDGATLVASELVTNAIQNSDGPVWVALDWGTSQPVLSVHDRGMGFELDSVPAPDHHRPPPERLPFVHRYGQFTPVDVGSSGST